MLFTAEIRRLEINENLKVSVTSMMVAPLRWGVCGTGRISSDFVNALATLDNHKVQAIASNSEERAKKFAEEHSIDGFYSNYDSLFSDKDIDVVYIGVVNSAHENVVISALDAGKHVLCEKPMGVNVKQVDRMIKKAQEKGLFLMEGYWTRFFPAMRHLREELVSGVIGDPLTFVGNFGFVVEGSQTKLDLAGGATLSVGCYLPMIASYVFFSNSKPEKPVKIQASATFSTEGVDETLAVTLMYKNGRVANMISSIRTFYPQTGFIAGTKGIITIPDHVWCPTMIMGPENSFATPVPESDKKFYFANSAGFQYEADHVRECLRQGLKESQLMPLNETLILAEINDEIRRQIGLSFPQE